MLELLPWLLASMSAILLIAASVLHWRRGRVTTPPPLPTEWALTARPVFNADERRVYRQLREALPHHIVLSKLPLVRFCQPNDPENTRYWYQLLGSIHVTFAICSANGRMLAAIDLDAERGGATRRAAQIKQAVLGACRVRYLRCPVDHLPSVPELQLLVPQASLQTRGPHAAPTMNQARDLLSSAVASRRRERHALWQDSSVFHDSFFSADSRADVSASDFGALRSSLSARDLRPAGEATPRPAKPPVPPPVRH
jgi:hypothetical protein